MTEEPRLDDPSTVRAEHAGDARLAPRRAAYANRDGPDPHQVAFEAVAAVRPSSVLEVGCGRGEFSARLADELSAGVVAVGLSPRMVELTRARGIDAHLADVQKLRFADAAFDCVVAWMLGGAGPPDPLPEVSPSFGWSDRQSRSSPQSIRHISLANARLLAAR